MTRIIGISGISGAGKTTLARAFAEKTSSAYLGWDDFDEISQGPEDYVKWHQDGQDYAEWDYPMLAGALRYLKAGRMIMHPVTKMPVEPTDTIIFDAPLGRLHDQTGRCIDIWVHLAIPEDIALCRRFLRDYENKSKGLEEIVGELKRYEQETRPLFNDTVYKEEADIILDATQPIELNLQLLEQHLSYEKLISTML